MNCFDKLEGIKKITTSIIEEYYVLLALDLNDEKESYKYEKSFKKLNELIEIERMYYSYLDIEDVIFLLNRMYLYGDNIVSSIIDIPFYEMDFDKFLWTRIFRNLNLEVMRKCFDNWNHQVKQIGMIPMFPHDGFNEDINSPYLSYKAMLLKGCFNTEYSYRTLDSDYYSDDFKTGFIYISSNVDNFIENYYLDKKFRFHESAIDVSESVIKVYENNTGIINDIVNQVFRAPLLNTLTTIKTLEEEEILEDDESWATLNAYIDIVCSIIKVLPNKYTTLLLNKAFDEEILALKPTGVVGELLDEEIEKVIIKKV